MKSDAMNNFIRGGGIAQPQPAPAGLTPERAERIEFFISKGATVREAIDLVMGQPGAAAHQVPEGNAGNGTGDHPPAPLGMNQWIRQAAGHI